MKEQLGYFQTEYVQYKDMAARLQSSYNTDADKWEMERRQMKERIKECEM